MHANVFAWFSLLIAVVAALVHLWGSGWTRSALGQLGLYLWAGAMLVFVASMEHMVHLP